MDLTDGEDGGVRGGVHPADHRLELSEEIAADHHRIHALLGIGTVAAPACDVPGENVEAGVAGSVPEPHRIPGKLGVAVKAHHRLGTFRTQSQHLLCAGPHLLGTLEDQLD